MRVDRVRVGQAAASIADRQGEAEAGRAVDVGQDVDVALQHSDAGIRHDVYVAVQLEQIARGVAYAAKGQWAEAQAALDTVTAINTTTPEGADGKTALSIAVHALSGEIATRRGDLAAGTTHFREAVKIEDGGLYFEPPKWYYPIRHSLGAALLKAGQNAEAEKVYREDLRRFPENGWSLFGLAQALQAQRKRTEAAAVEARFRRAWASTDVTLTASRF